MSIQFAIAASVNFAPVDVLSPNRTAARDRYHESIHAELCDGAGPSRKLFQRLGGLVSREFRRDVSMLQGPIARDSGQYILPLHPSYWEACDLRNVGGYRYLRSGVFAFKNIEAVLESMYVGALEGTDAFIDALIESRRKDHSYRRRQGVYTLTQSTPWGKSSTSSLLKLFVPWGQSDSVHVFICIAYHILPVDSADSESVSDHAKWVEAVRKGENPGDLNVRVTQIHLSEHAWVVDLFEGYAFTDDMSKHVTMVPLDSISRVVYSQYDGDDQEDLYRLPGVKALFDPQENAAATLGDTGHIVPSPELKGNWAPLTVDQAMQIIREQRKNADIMRDELSLQAMSMDGAETHPHYPASYLEKHFIAAYCCPELIEAIEAEYPQSHSI